MRKRFSKLLALLLVCVMMLQASSGLLAQAAEQVHETLDPAEQIELLVPEALRDDGDYFFIRTESFTVSEKAEEKLYIPIQRAGDLDAEAEVTLKLIDVTSLHDVNYTAEIYREQIEPEIAIADVSLLDLTLHAADQEEFDPLDEQELGEAVYAQGGADVVDANGNTIGELTAQPVDEDGNPIEMPAPAAEEAEKTSEETEVPAADVQTLEPDDTSDAGEWSDAPQSQTDELRRARDSFTGTVSDRQEMNVSDDILQQPQEEESELIEDSYPGREYRLHFAPGEEAKYLVITPMYSEQADGDCQLMLMLKDPDGEQQIPEEFLMSAVIIQDEDESQPAVIRMAAGTIYAENGKACITVEREGSINSIVGAHLSSWDGSAEMGEDYGGVGADLYFPMGITSRTVELPVLYGEELKDFFVTLTPLEGSQVTIGEQRTTRVIIPAADQEIIASGLMRDASSQNIKLGEQINLRNARGYKIGTYFEWKDDGYGFRSETSDDKENEWAGWHWTLNPGYFYDGFLAKYDYYLNWCDGKINFDTFGDEMGQRTNSKRDNDGGSHTGKEMYWYFAETKTPYAARANICNCNNDGWFWTDDWASLTVKSVEPIIRRFKIQLTSAVMEDGSKPYFHGTDASTTKEYVFVQLNKSNVDTCYIWGGENFSVNQPMGQRYTRLVALEAVKADGTTYRIGVNDGTSQSVVATLSESLVNKLGEQGFFQWEKGPGGPNKDGNSKQGVLTVRPVFAYIFAEANVVENQYGELLTDTPIVPTILWDFNNDNVMTGRMGTNSRHKVDWKSEKDADGSEYYVFTAQQDDPYVSVDLPAADASEVVWAKVRAKNLCGADAIELYGHTGGKNLSGPECVHVDLEKDTEWHTYLINIPEENIRTANAYKGCNLSETVWKGKVDWVRLDPVWFKDGESKGGEQIAIDYVAFFSTKEAAELFRSEEMNAGTYSLKPGNYRFHMGDLLQVHTAVSETGELAGLTGDGFRFDLYVERNGAFIDGANIPYINELGELKLRGLNQKEDKTGDYYRLEPTFTQTANQVVVQIDQDDLQYFDTDSDLFRTEDKWLDGTTWNYRVAANVRSNELYELWAPPKDPTHVPLWTCARDSGVYSGNAFYFMTGVYAADNVITLTVDRTASNHAYYVLSGTTYSQVMNLNTGRASDVIDPAQEALLTCGMCSAISDEYGDFTLPTLYLVGNTTVRYTVTYNGSVNIRETKLAPAGARKQAATYTSLYDGSVSAVQAIPVSLNTVTVDSFSVTGAHFEKVDLEQDGILGGLLSTVEMNGQKVVFTVKVNPGERYIYNNEVFTEQIKDVKFYFQHQTTKEIHGVYSIHDKYDPLVKGKVTWDPETLTATLTFESFNPDTPGEYGAGDVLMLQLTTDKKVSLAAWNNLDMTYDPVASGYAVVTDLDYEPQEFDYELPSVENLLQILGPDDSGTGTGSDYSFGRLPFLGEVTTGVKILTILVNRAIGGSGARKILSDLRTQANANAPAGDIDGEEWNDEGDDGTYDTADDGLSGGEGEGAVPQKSWSISVAFSLERTYYGGMRFMIAVIASHNFLKSPYRNQTNPYKDGAQAWEYFTSGRYASGVNGQDGEKLIFNNTGFGSKGEEIRSHFGGGHFKIGLYVGIYIDFGYVVGTDGNKSADLIFMGAGGFFGGQATLGYTFYTTIFGIPAYVNPEASIDLTFFLGASANPDMTLKNFKANSTLAGDDFRFNFEFKGRLEAGVTIGLGIYKVLGVRASAIFGFEAGYGLHMAEWYPEVGTGWGFTTDITFKGTIDFVVGSIDLVDYSWPLPWNGGWMYCMQEVRRANVLLTFVNGGIEDGRGSAAARNKAQEMADDLSAYVEDRTHIATETLKAKTTALRKYAYDEDIITWMQNNRVQMNRQGGVIGGIIEDAQMGDYKSSNLTSSDSAETTTLYRTRNHVQSRWIGGDKTRGAFQPVHSETLMEDAFTQTNSQITALGGNRFLVVFLDDEADRDRQQAAALKWTVYDANSDKWTLPALLQDDATADSKPSLTDAGDKVILTWSSIPGEKYEALKAEIKTELTELGKGEAPSEAEILMELEADPVRVMEQMEIFTAMFDKTAQTFGAIEQLTDDNYYDDGSQAVYDETTGDYVVLYYKTAQTAGAYTDPAEQLIDLAGVGANPGKTYSVLSYMLYNNQTETPDAQGNTHEAGWARDYLFPNETAQDAEGQANFLARWKGQRFLPTAIAGMSDPPIGDLTVCAGYNGIGAYAFTVDKDYDLGTGSDKELYVQFYRFAEHKTYVPVKVAGEVTENGVTTAVDVGSPQLVRNDGSTWLFWRQDEDGLQYLNVSELMNAKVASKEDPGDDDWTWAVQDDGTFAVDAVTGERYSPKAQAVDFGSVMTDKDINATEYRVITDGFDNLYVVWTDTVLYETVDEEIGEACQRTAHEIYASAMIKEGLDVSGDTTDVETDETAPVSGTAQTANWSKPYRLTKDNRFNDGIALALDDKGGLIILHNQYDQLRATSDEDVKRLLEEGQLTTREVDCTTYVLGSLWYNSPIRLTLTRCDAVGSLEATSFSFSHSHPVAGETVQVWSVIENVGLTSANGCVIDFYEAKDGVQGRKVAHYESDEELRVNTARMVNFLWQIPEDGPEGYSLQAVISEQKPDDSYYPATVSQSGAFTLETAYELTLDSFVQNGDAFDAQFSVTNTGNLAVPEGTNARLHLIGLYGDLAERYGMDDDLLISEDISGLEPRETRVITKSVELPVSVFEYCGYDAVQASVKNANGIVAAESTQQLIVMDAPLHPTLNGGKTLVLPVGGELTVPMTYETNAFLTPCEIVYSVEDTSVASVDADGKVTGLASGETVLTATLLPSGRTAEITVRVREDFQFEDVLDQNAYFYDPVYWAVDQGITNGTSPTTFSPGDACTRAQVVTFLWRTAGSPAPAAETCDFTDVKADAYYCDAVLWAAEKGITVGTTATTFSPDDPCNRAQIVTFLWRAAGSPAPKDAASPFTDMSSGQFFYQAVLWAVEQKITNGTAEKTFSPYKTCTRAETVTFLYRCQGEKS